MKDILTVFPELTDVLLEAIPAASERYYVRVRIVSLFRETLLEDSEISNDLVDFAVRAIPGYLEYPILYDNLTDNERKALKMKGSELLRTFLADTKLHRINISKVIQMLDLLPEIELTPDLLKVKELIRHDVENESKYDNLSNNERVHYVQYVVTPFVREVCVNYIKSKI